MSKGDTLNIEQIVTRMAGVSNIEPIALAYACAFGARRIAGLKPVLSPSPSDGVTIILS